MSLVSVVMPLYNTEERYLRCAIESILKQTYTNFEFIIVCDKPTDGSEQIAEEYAALDSRIVVLKNDVNSGIAQTLNNGLKIAKGDYIARMDADDISPPKRLQKQVSYLSKHKDVGIVFMKRKVIDENGKIRCSYSRNLRKKEIVPTLFFGCLLCHPSAMFRRSVVQEYDNVYDPHSKAEDYDLWTRLAVKGVSFAQVNSVSFLYRMHSQQVTQTRREQVIGSASESLYAFVSACGVTVTEESLNKYSMMMTSYGRISKEDYVEGLRVFEQILSCELIEKHDSARFRRRKFFMRMARWLGIRRHY